MSSPNDPYFGPPQQHANPGWGAQNNGQWNAAPSYGQEQEPDQPVYGRPLPKSASPVKRYVVSTLAGAGILLGAGGGAFATIGLNVADDRQDVAEALFREGDTGDAIRELAEASEIRGEAGRVATASTTLAVGGALLMPLVPAFRRREERAAEEQSRCQPTQMPHRTQPDRGVAPGEIHFN